MIGYYVGYYGGLALIGATLYHYFPETTVKILTILFGFMQICILSAWSFLEMLANLLK